MGFQIYPDSCGRGLISPFPFSPSILTDGSSQFQCIKIVFGKNKLNHKFLASIVEKIYIDQMFL